MATAQVIYDPTSGNEMSSASPARPLSTSSCSSDDTPLAALAEKRGGGISSLKKSPSEDSVSTLYEMDAAESMHEEAQQDYDDDEEEEEEEEEEDYLQRPPRRQASSTSGVGAEIRNAFLAGRMREGDVMEEDDEEEKVEAQKVHVENSQEQDDAMLPADDVVHAPVTEEFVDAEEGTDAVSEHQKDVVGKVPAADAKAEQETLPTSEPQAAPIASDVPASAESVPQVVAQPAMAQPHTQDSHANVASLPAAAAAALTIPATTAPATVPAPSATFLVPAVRKNEPEQSTPVHNNQFGKSASEVSLPKPTATAATATPAQKPRGAALLQMSHANHSAPVIGQAAKTAPVKKSKNRFANCFSWLPGVSKKKDATGTVSNTRSVPPPMTAASPAAAQPQARFTPAPTATKIETPMVNINKPAAHAVAEKRSIASFKKDKAPPTAAAAASLHAPSIKDDERRVVNASTGKPPVTLEAASARSGSPVNAIARSSSSSPAPRVDSLGVTPLPRDIDSVSATDSTSSERRSIFRGGRNASREHMSDYRHDKSSNSLRMAGSRKGSVSTASQRTAPENGERGNAHNEDDKHHHDGDADAEDATSSNGGSAEVYTLHSRASQMTLSLPEMPKLGDLDVAIPPAPGRTELPYHSVPAPTITKIDGPDSDVDRESAASPVRRTTTTTSAPSLATSTTAEQEENEKLELLRAVVGDSTRHVKESAAAHRRRWDEELQGSDTSGGRAAAAASGNNTPQVGSIPRSSLEQQQRSVRSSLLYDGLSRSPSSGTTATAAAAAAAVVTPPATPSSSTARLTSPSRLFLNQDFQQGAFSSSPFSSSFTSLASSSGAPAAAAAAAAATKPAAATAALQLDPLEKLYHDICNSGMDLDQLAGKYDSNATRRPTAKRNGSSGKMVGGVADAPPMPNTPPRSVVAGGAGVADDYAGNNAIDGWRKNIARALESTHNANRSGVVPANATAAAAAAPLSPPPSPAWNNHHESSPASASASSTQGQPSGIRQKALVSRRTPTGAAPRANVDRQAVWSLHEDFVAALDGTDGDPDNDLAGVVGFALAMHDGQA
ncbi:hypothetical protein HDU90_005630 [Geranomyces variabilis]|nr:hypothetical protein HDU90_005630 [Geranomyces variabilis]